MQELRTGVKVKMATNSNDETISNNKTISNDETFSNSETFSNNEKISSYETISSNEMISIDETISNDETISSWGRLASLQIGFPSSLSPRTKCSWMISGKDTTQCNHQNH